MVGVAYPGVRALVPWGYGTTDADVEEVRYICHRTSLCLGVVDCLPDTVCMRESMCVRVCIKKPIRQSQLSFLINVTIMTEAAKGHCRSTDR